MSSHFKKTITILISVTTAGLTGWLVKAAYDGGNFQLPAVLLAVSVTGQVIVTLIASEEEKLILNLRREIGDMHREREIWHRVEISKLERRLAIAKQQVVEIERGNMVGVREWSDVEKCL